MGREGPEVGSMCRDLGHREDSGEGRGQRADGVQDLLQSLSLKTRWNGCGHMVGGHMWGDLLSSHVPHWGFKRLCSSSVACHFTGQGSQGVWQDEASHYLTLV